MNKNVFAKRFLAWVLAFALAFTTVFANGTTVEAASSKAVKKVTVKIDKKNVTKKTYTLTKGKSKTLKVSVSPNSAKKSVSYKSSKKSVATVSKKGKVTAKKAGTAKITVTVTGKNKKKKSTWVKIKVVNKSTTSTTQQPTTQKKTTERPTTQQPTTQKPTTEKPTPEQPTTPSLTKIKVSADTVSITEKGGQAKLTVESDTEGVAIKKVEYKSSNTQIATVDEDGVVTGVNYNSAPVIITVTAYDANGNKAVGTISITVTQLKTAVITLAEADTTLELYKGETKTLKPVVTEATVDAVVDWASSDSSVATVENGTITAVSAGTTKITATVRGTNASVSCTVKVSEEAPGIASFEATHADRFMIKLTAPIAEEDREKVKISLKIGKDELTSVIPTWADNGKSIELQYGSEYTPGKYTVSISGDDVSINPDKSTSSAKVEERVISDIDIKTSYIPSYKKAKIRFDALDQYGDAMQNVVASQFVWHVSCDSPAVDTSYAVDEDELSNKGYIVINSELDNLVPDTDKLTITAYLDSDPSIICKKEVSVNYLKVKNITITGTKEDKIYETTKNIPVELTYTATDNYGGKVDMEAYFAGAYKSTITSTTSDPTICTRPYVADNGTLVVDVQENVNGKATVTVMADDQKKSEYTIEVLKAPYPYQVDFTKAELDSVIAGEKAKLAIDVSNQYGEKMEIDQLTVDKLKSTLNVAVSGFGDDLSADDISFEITDTECLMVVDTKDVTESGTAKIAVSSKDDLDVKSTYELSITAPRAANHINITKAPKDSILVGETIKIEFVIEDAYNTAWTDNTTYEIYGDDVTNEYITVSEAVINADGTGYIEVKGLAASTKAANSPKISLSLKKAGSDEFITTTPMEYSIAVNNNVDSISSNTDNTRYSAGQKVKITLTAKYDEGKVLTTYNETIEALDVYESVNNTKVITIPNVTFVNGVATIEVDAMYVGKEVKYTAEFTSPGNTEATKIETPAVEIVAGEAVKYDMDVDATSIKVTFVDVKGNVVDTKDISSAVATIKITSKTGNKDVTSTYIDGLDSQSQKTVTFTDGVATITLKDEIPNGATITFKYNSLEGTYTLD